MSDHLRRLIESAKAEDFQSLAKLLTVLESRGLEVLQDWPELLHPPQMALRVGITGPPGAGKSTLVGQLIHRARQKSLKIGVIAVDPSSPFSKGAILADRIRYSEHFSDPQVFIRSLGSRGSLGGLSASAYLMLRAMDHCGFDLVLVETVGVGQTELEIMYVGDTVAVVLVPESGDSVQAMKAGLMEIADVFVVNKSDRPGAEAMTKELEAAAGFYRTPPEVIPTTATEGKGLDRLAEVLFAGLSDRSFEQKRNNPTRLQAEALALLRVYWERQAESKVAGIQTLEDLAKTLTQVVDK